MARHRAHLPTLQEPGSSYYAAAEPTSFVAAKSAPAGSTMPLGNDVVDCTHYFDDLWRCSALGNQIGSYYRTGDLENCSYVVGCHRTPLVHCCGIDFACLRHLPLHLMVCA